MADIFGTSAGETLAGTSGDDIITGGGGRDRLSGGAGDDTLTGGEESDNLYGESGNDNLDGGGGNDWLEDGAGDDIAHGGDGDDVIESEADGSDQLYGGAGIDSITLGRLKAGNVVDAFGGSGRDYFHVNDLAAGSTINIDGGDDEDTIWFGQVAGTLNVTFGGGRDVLDPISSFTYLASHGVKLVVLDWDGGATGDIFDPTRLLSNSTSWNRNSNPFTTGFLRLVQSGSDVLLGYSATAFGTFKDVVQFKNTNVAAFGAETFGGYSPDGGVDAGHTIVATGADRARLTGGSGDDVIQGSDSYELIWGGLGNDSLSGGGNGDTLYGGAGNDSIDGGDGGDLIEGNGGNDVLHGGAGNDSLYDTGGGTDAVYGEEGNDFLSVTRSSKDQLGASSLYGGDGNDSFSISLGNASSLALDGGAGDDTFSFSAVVGAITVALGGGTDEIRFNQSGNSGSVTLSDFQTGDGGDRVDLAGGFLPGWDRVSNPFTAGLARVVQSGADALLQYKLNGAFVTLATFSNTAASSFTAFNLGGFSVDGSVPAGIVVNGTSADETLRAGEGDDQVYGADGNDRLYLYAGNDQASGGDGSDTLYGGLGNDRLDGAVGDDILYGNAGDDILQGGDGRDYLDPGQGVDQLFGGADDDTLSDTADGSHLLHGDDGNDSIGITRYNAVADHLSVYGDAGDDRITFNVYQAGTLATIDAGSGNDRVILIGAAAATVTLGAGADVLELPDWLMSGVPITVTDFEAGVGGDSLDFDGWLANTVAEGDSNPFTSGYLRLVQSGADTLLQVDTDGPGAGSTWTNLLTLSNVDVTTLLPANVDNYLLPQLGGTEADDTLTGTGDDDTINGKGGNDSIQGFAGADQLHGGDGNDTVDGGIGADTVTGDAGDDVLAGGADDDTISGGDGADQIEGGSERDILHGDAGDDVVAGGDGNDDVYGDLGSDTLTGGAGADFLIGDLGDDHMDAGDGNDTIYSDVFDSAPQHDVAIGGAGSDILWVDFFDVRDSAPGVTMTIAADAAGGYSGTISAGADYGIAFSTVELFGILGTSQNDQITTGGGNDMLAGQFGDDVLAAGAGNDWLIGGGGADSMTGGAGNDRYDVDSAGDVLIEAAGEGTDLVEVRLAAYALPDNLENLTGLLATGQQLTGNGAANLIKGGAGDDVIDGGAGADILQGGGGNDVYYLDNVGDSVTDAGGVDEVRVSLASYSIAANTSLENLTGLADTGQVLTGNGLANILRGSGGDDQLNGGSGIDSLYGGAGADVLDGGTGGDTMRGEQGDDSYYVDSGLDTIVELAGEGQDRVFTALASYALAANVENFTGTSAFGQRVTGNGLDNGFTMGGGNDVLDLSTGGDDSASGGGGNDYFFFGGAFTAADSADGGSGTDTVALLGNYDLTLGATTLVGVETLNLLSGSVLGGSDRFGYSIVTNDANVPAGGQLTVFAGGLLADETLLFNASAETDGVLSAIGGAGNDIFAGGPANDTFVGGGGNDFLVGLGGNDWLQGDGGADTLRGGFGSDLFVYKSASDSPAGAMDHILDFEDTTDLINLQAIDANVNVGGDQAFTFIGADAFHGTAGELRVYQSGADFIVEGDTDGDGSADFAIQVTTVTGYGLDAPDFML